MKPILTLLWCSCLLFVSAAQARGASSPEWAKAEPAVTYGALPGFSLPKTIIFSVSPDEIIADAQAWQQHGVNAFFLDFVAEENSPNGFRAARP